MPQILYTLHGRLCEVGQYHADLAPVTVAITVEDAGVDKHRVEMAVGVKTATNVARHLFEHVIITVALADDAEDE